MTEHSSSPYDDVLPAEEFERRVTLARQAAHGPAGDGAAELVAWFLRRYPEPHGPSRVRAPQDARSNAPRLAVNLGQFFVGATIG